MVIYKKSLIFLLILISIILVRSICYENIYIRPLNDFDEARYAEVAKNILKTGNWILPMAGGPDEPRNMVVVKLTNGADLYPYFWKPPLHTIVLALSYKVFGINEFALRLPSLLFSILASIVFYLIAFKLLAGRSLYIFISNLIFTSTADFSFLSSQGLAEMQYLCFALVSIYLIQSKINVKWLFSGMFLGLAFMTKSFATFWVFPIVYAYYYVLYKKWGSVKNILQFVSGALFVVTPWHFYMFNRFGQVFVDRYLLVNLIGRANGAQQNIAPIYWYVVNLSRSYPLVLFGILCVFFVFVLGRIKKFFNEKILIMKDFHVVMFLLSWILIVLVPFSLMKSKVWWYVFPIWIPISILVSRSVIELEKNNILKLTYTSICSFLVLILSLITFFQSLFIANSRDFGTSNIRKLASRHQNLGNLGVVGRAYESILFYFNTGNVSNRVKNVNYLLEPIRIPQTDPEHFQLIDSEDDLGLYRRN